MTWQKVKIGSFLKERTDRFKPEEANRMGLKRLEKIDFSGKIHIADNKPTKTGMILVKKGDLVISGINVEKGAVAVYSGEEDVLATIHYSSYIFDREKIDIEYFKWFLKSRTFREVVNSQIKSGIKTELKPKRFLPLEIYLPDIETQRRIRDKLNSVSEEIRKTSELCAENEELVQKLRQAILMDAVSGKLVPQDPDDEPASVLLEKIKKEKERLIREKKIKKEKPLPPITEKEIPYELPKGWEWVRLNDITERIHYGFNASANEKHKEVRLLRITDIQNNNVNWENVPGCIINEREYQSYCLQRNDILIARTGGTVGKSYLVQECPYKVVFASYLIRIIPLNLLNSHFIKYFLESPIYWHHILKKAGGGAQPNVNGTALKNMLFPLPPLNEQKRIVQKVDQLMAFCDELEEEIKKSRVNTDKLLDSVLYEAFDVKIQEA